jgi:hypothetical protein
MLPMVTTYNLAAAVSTNVVNAAPIQGPGALPLVSTTVVLDNQRRLLITTGGNESSNTFTVKGLNQANNTITETITGPNASTTQSNLDFKTVLSVTALATTAGTVSVGTDGAGSSLWNIVNWHVTPVNIEVSGVVTSPSTAVNYTIQYTYDDPNNLPSGVNFPQPFSHPTIVNQTASLDGPINDPVTGVRLLINSGTGTVRMTVIQAGIGGP